MEGVMLMSLLMLKSVLATVVLILAVGQAVSGLRLQGRFKRLPLPLGALRIWHRLSGDITLALTTLVGIICIANLGFSLYTYRERGHVALGVLAGLAMVMKVLMARKYRGLLRHALKVGAVAGFSALGVFIFSALWYFILVW
jgi:hypothetical protein